MAQPRGPYELEPACCRELIASGTTGRIAVSTAVGPQVAPVGYTVVGDALVVWTSPFSVIARCAPGTFVAFEVDAIDPVTREGWYVQARGRAELLTDPEAVDQLAPVVPLHREPGGERARHCLVVRWSELSGQAVGSREHREHQEHGDHRDHGEHRDHRDHRDHREAEPATGRAAP